MILSCFGVSNALALESESGVQANFCHLEGVRDGQVETPTSCRGLATVVVHPQCAPRIPKHAKGKYGMPALEVTSDSLLCSTCPSPLPIVSDCSLRPGDRDLAQESEPSQASSCSNASSFRQYFRPRPPKMSRSWIDCGSTAGENACQYYHVVHEPEVEEDRTWQEFVMKEFSTSGRLSSTSGVLPSLYEG